MTNEEIFTEQSFLQVMSPKPAEKFADWVNIYEEDGVLRFVFSATRPDAESKFADPSVIVARIAMSRRRFEALLADALKKIDG